MRRQETYDDTEPLLEPENEEDKMSWDSFRNRPRTLESSSTAEPKYIEAGTKLLKIFTVAATFCIVLGTAVVSKGTLLFMTSQIKEGVTRSYCNKKIEPNQEFQVTLPDSERVVWMWLIIFSYMVPELGTFLRSVRILCFKSWSFPTAWEFFWLFLTETLPAIGSALLVFIIFPELDVIKAAMLTNCVCVVPAFITFFSRNPHGINSTLRMVLDILAIIAQASAFVVWPLVDGKVVLYIIPISLIFISFGWWENFVSEKSPIGFIQKLAESKKEFENKTYFMYAIIAPWKCIVFFVTAIVSLVIREGDATFLFTKFSNAFESHEIYVNETGPSMGDSSVIYGDAIASGFGTAIETSVGTPISVWLINGFCTYLCYTVGKFSCKIMIQTSSFALPINLAVPVLLTGLIGLSGNYTKDVCAYTNIIPEYLFFNTPSKYSLNEFISHQHSWIWLIWLLSQFWITLHIWTNNNEKLASTEKLFFRPTYDAYLIDQSLALNRRKIEYDMKPPIKVDNNEESPLEMNKDKITRIYACATMWHETKTEMVEFLKSILRMDEDQCAHRIVRNYLQYNLNNYYEFETHILFDDAFVRTSQEDQDPHINQYVLDLIESVDIAAEEVHRTNVNIRPPVIYATPYGGRLVWTLPGKTKMIAHLKDKAKIRPKKRWSQVMYMYYLLGHRIMENHELTPERVAAITENTYLLALDGDMNFQPHAVQLLVDYMKRNRSLGAACGRLHPIGAGVMTWCQKFEYAISHWLHKATEHVIGCVLCSPGCFSLFRAKALMDDNVMAKYTTVSEEAEHYLQHDQGEDRWLCTLLLQRGYRVEYSAASDAYTHCPEGFSEFYNQRRRWIPSTAAHIIDLLTDYEHFVKINDNISKPFILYQLLVLITTAIGPGTIFLMLVGGFVAAFKLAQWTSFILNIVPILIFVTVCATCKANTQLFFAGAISAVYGLVMMAVLIGIIMQMSEDGWLAPSSLFFICLALEFIVAAIIHPQEFYCLKYGLIYYVTVPSMYMLLVIYSVFNLNSVSWGTREVTVVPKSQSEKGGKKKPDKKHKIYSLFGKNNDNTGSFEFSCAGLFKILCCTHQRVGEENYVLKNIHTSLMQLQQKLDNSNTPSQLERNPFTSEQRRPTHLEGPSASRASFIRNSATHILKNNVENVNEDYDGNSILAPSENTEDENSWFYDLIKSEVACLERKEETFWTNVIDKYLHPIDDSLKKDKVTKNLKDLRDKIVVTFLVINSLFVLVVFFLTLQRKTVRMTWLIDPKVNFIYFLDQNEIRIQKTYLELEPTVLVFLIFFAILMVIQFFAMLIHRFGTYSQIMANTLINWYPFKCLSKKVENLTEEQILEQDPVKIIKKLMKLRGISDEDEENEVPVTHRNTAHTLALNKKIRKPVIEDLDKAFSIRIERILNSENDELPVPNKTLLAIGKRRNKIQRRKSQIPSHFDNMECNGDNVGTTFDEPRSQES